MKTIIDIKGVITKENGKAFTEAENEQLIDEFLKLIESKGFLCGGGLE